MGATMGFVGGLLKFHGLLESAAGIAMIVVTEMVFPFLAGQSLEVQYVGKMFGAAILALGLTALMPNVSSGILFGAFAYHSTVTSLFVRQLFENIVSDPDKTTMACGVHGFLALLFAFAWAPYSPQKVKTK